MHANLYFTTLIKEWHPASFGTDSIGISAFSSLKAA
jgi:hypothetical protein